MKVAFYAPLKSPRHPSPSGDRTIARGLWDAFVARGHECLLLSEFRSRWFYRSPLRAASAAGHLAAAAARAARFQPDLFFTYHLYYKAPDPIGAPLSALLRKPYAVYEASHAESPRARWSTAPGYHLARWALARAGHAFSGMSDDRLDLGRVLPGSRISHVPPSVDARHFRPDAARRARWRRERGIGADETVVACVGMARDERKTASVRLLIETLDALDRRGVRARLVHAGGGERLPELRALAARRLGSSAILTGPLERDEVAELLCGADIFAFPGVDEGFGLVYLEAQASGLPVVALRDGGVSDAVTHGEGGLLAPPDVPGAFAAELERLIVDAGLRARLGAAGRLRAVTRHDPAANYGAVVARCEALVGGRG